MSKLTQEEIEQIIKEKQEALEKAFTRYITDELHAYVLADLLVYISANALESVKEIRNIIGAQDKVYQKFRLRSDAVDRLGIESKRLLSVLDRNVKEAFSVDQFDEQVGAISEHMKELFSMDPIEIHQVLLATKMVQNGKFPTYVDLETIEKQEIAKLANIPAEHVFKVFQHIPQFCVKT